MTAALAALAALVPAAAAPTLGGQGAPATAPTAQKAPAPQVRFDLRLTRTDEPAPPNTLTPNTQAPPAPAPIASLLGAPMLTTLAGQTASMNVTGADPSFSVSLSPVVESVDNGQQVQVAWNLRLSGKALPGGVTAVTLTGATRILANAAGDVTVAEVTLTDPATGRVSRFRLGGRVTVGSGGGASAGTPAPAQNPAPAGATAGTNGAALTSY